MALACHCNALPRHRQGDAYVQRCVPGVRHVQVLWMVSMMAFRAASMNEVRRCQVSTRVWLASRTSSRDGPRALLPVLASVVYCRTS